MCWGVIFLPCYISVEFQLVMIWLHAGGRPACEITLVFCNCSCNCGICIVHPTDRLRAHHRTIASLYPDVRWWRKVLVETALVQLLSVTCAMLVVQQQRKCCCRFFDMSTARRGHQTKHTVQIVLVSSPRCVLECGPAVTCGLASTTCTGSFRQLVTIATLGQLGSHGCVAWDPEQYVLQCGGLAKFLGEIVL